MSPRRHLVELVLALLTVVAMMLAAPAYGHATTFTAPSLVSYEGISQASDAYQPAIAANGQYVAFVGVFNGVQGIWRKDLQTGELDLVAGASGDAAIDAPDAGSPSISEDGRYVAFTTTADLDPAQDPGNGCSSVYLRDMSVAANQPGAYILVSALSGTGQGITYGGSSAGSGHCPGGGSASADRVAISADGNEVAFTVLGQSDLTTGTASQITTPPDQVAVRYIAQQQTVLVSQTMASEQGGGPPQPVPDGAAMTTSGDATVNSSTGEPISASTAAISADGSTVAWLGIDIPAQAPASSQDAPDGYPDEFDEPLWREIALGPGAATRRVTGGDDPAAAGGAGPFDEFFNSSQTNNSGDTGPEFGTYVAPGHGFGGVEGSATDPSLDAATPALSANGQEVAFLSNQYLNDDIPVGAPGQGAPGPNYGNAYVVDMADGLTRDAALTQLTEVASEPVNEIAISPDGNTVAFTTADIAFPLAAPALVTPPPSSAAGIGIAQLYEVDLTADTVSLASYGYDGEQANGTVEDPSFTSAGNTIAFASAATNLVYGAQNDGTDVFTVTEETSIAAPGSVSISPTPTVAVVPRWVLSITGRATRTGAARIAVSVPGAGRLTASATAVAPTGARASTVAQASKRVRHAAIVTLMLTPRKAYAARVGSRRGLLATISVRLSAAGRRTLNKSLQLTLRAKPTRRRSKRTQRKRRKAVHG
jgi:Tol biopolymer transport system component